MGIICVEEPPTWLTPAHNGTIKVIKHVYWRVWGVLGWVGVTNTWSVAGGRVWMAATLS